MHAIGLAGGDGKVRDNHIRVHIMGNIINQSIKTAIM